jgi:hypothetical protein
VQYEAYQEPRAPTVTYTEPVVRRSQYVQEPAHTTYVQPQTTYVEPQQIVVEPTVVNTTSYVAPTPTVPLPI